MNDRKFEVLPAVRSVDLASIQKHYKELGLHLPLLEVTLN